MVPLLLGAAAIWGISNVAEAEEKANSANRINKEAAELANTAHNAVTEAHDNMMDVLNDLGNLKQRTSHIIGITGDMIEDITKKLRREKDTKSLKELEDAGIYENLLTQMQKLSVQAQNISVANQNEIDTSENTNAACVFGALGGAALGFGAVAMPAMLLYSFVKSDEAKAAYYEAKTRMDEAQVYAERCNNMCSLFNAIEKRGGQIEYLLKGLNKYFLPAAEALENVQNTYGNEYRSYTPEAKMTVFYSFQLAQTVKTVVETPMFNEDWSMNPDVDKTLDKGHDTLRLLASN